LTIAKILEKSQIKKAISLRHGLGGVNVYFTNGFINDNHINDSIIKRLI